MSKVSDFFPDFCLTFSPNWYLPQIISYDKLTHILACGVNNSVFLMDYISKAPITSFLCEKSPSEFIEKNKFASELKTKPVEGKITCVLLFQQYIFAGFENGIISLWKLDLKTKSQIQIFAKKYDFCKEILFLIPYKIGNIDKILCIDSQGVGFLITYSEKGIINEELRKTKMMKEQEENNKRKIVACRVLFEVYVAFVYKIGKIEIWSRNFDVFIYEIDIKKKILYFDAVAITENNQEAVKILVMTKEKSKHTLISSYLSKNDVDFMFNERKSRKADNSIVEEGKEKPEIKLGSIRYEITLDFHITENYIKNKEDLKQASVCAKFLNPQEVHLIF